MKGMGRALFHKYPNADPIEEIMVEATEDGEEVLKVWNVKDENGNPVPRPTGPDLQNWLLEADGMVYQEKRAKEYPNLIDQLDAIWKSWTPPAGSEAENMRAKIMAIKAKYPKPNSTPTP
jgi:hypothetical protein